MKGIKSNMKKKEATNTAQFNFARKYIWVPTISGLFGFSMFFTILLSVKLFSYTIGTYTFFAIEMSDLALSSIGFVLLFLIKELENF